MPVCPARVSNASARSQVAVFLDELALLVVLAVAGARIGGGAVASTLRAIFFPLAAAVIWGLWLAPRARRRLAHPARLAAKLVLVAIASLLLALSGALWWARCVPRHLGGTDHAPGSSRNASGRGSA